MDADELVSDKLTTFGYLMKTLFQFSLILFFFSSRNCSAQYFVDSYGVEILRFPMDNQLYPRLQGQSAGLVEIQGEISGNPSYMEIHLRVYRGTEIVFYESVDFFTLMDKQGFSFAYTLPAELVNYTFELYGTKQGGGQVLLKKAQNVVAGDVFLLTGQSNAVAKKLSGDANVANAQYRPFVHVFGSADDKGTSLQWFIGDGNANHTDQGNVGQLGMRFAALLAERYGRPIALMNGAHGGQPIEFFQKTTDVYTIYDELTNYGRMDYRMMAAGLKNSVTGIVFYQGEHNARLGISTADYKQKLESLSLAWKADYASVQKLYFFRNRMGCNASINNVLKVNQAQKEFTEVQANNARLISTNYTAQFSDNCHFPYTDGYEVLGKRVFEAMRTDIFGEPVGSNTLSPYAEKASLISDNSLAVTVKQSDDAFLLSGNFASDLRLEGQVTYTITGLRINENILTVNFNKVPANGAAPTGLTVMSHTGGKTPGLINANNTGMISFFNLPVDASPSVANKEVLISNNMYTAGKLADSSLAGGYQPVLLKSSESADQLLIFPNPVTDRFYIRDFSGVTQVDITDLTGRSVYQSKGIAIGEVNVKNFSNGIYVVNITRANGLHSSQRIVISK